MRFKTFILFLINFFSVSAIFTNEPPNIPTDKIYIRPMYDEDTGELRLRWDDDTNQFLAFNYSQLSPEESRRLLQEHFQQIRNNTQNRIQRYLNNRFLTFSEFNVLFGIYVREHTPEQSTALTAIHFQEIRYFMQWKEEYLRRRTEAAASVQIHREETVTEQRSHIPPAPAPLHAQAVSPIRLDPTQTPYQQVMRNVVGGLQITDYSQPAG